MKRMPSYGSCCFLIVLSASIIPAQEKRPKAADKPRPDFSGTWRFEESNFALARKGTIHKRRGFLVVVHRDPEIKIVVKAGEGENEETLSEETYFTDSRGETNLLWPITSRPSIAKRESMKSRTRWEGNKIVTRITQRTIEDGHVMIFDIVDTLQLSSDGQTLTRTNRVRSDDSDSFSEQIGIGPGEYKEIFRRVT